jgi:hypothetical protein
MRESRFVNLTSYCIVEYMLEDLGSLDVINDDFILLQNDHIDAHQIFNPDGSFNRTRNIQDVTVVPIEGSRYAYLDSEKVPNYIDYDDKITETTISGYNVTLDKVRFHFIAGFEFDDFRALVLSIRNIENDTKTNIFANILFNQDTSSTLLTFNPKPLYITNSMYDRYVDVYIPSIKNINEEFNTSPTPGSTFAAAITPKDSSYTGFVTNKPIIVSIDECATQETIDTNIGVTYEAFKVSEHYETVVSQSNEFDAVGAYINESTEGDFIEFFLTFNGGFPEDLISILNRRNPLNDYIIAHELTVFEQIGSSFVESSRLAFFQDNNFDEPNLFRPVLKNANTAITMSIDYIVRLVNRFNGEQVIREGSLIVNSPKKYGRTLLKLELADKPQSQVIVNKIYKKNFEATELFIDPAQNVTSTIGNGNTTVINSVQYVPIFFTKANIIASNRSYLTKESNNQDEVVFQNGKLRFVLSPFDNYLKFKFYTLNNNKLTTLDLNSGSTIYRAVFETASGKIKIDNINDQSKENPSQGEITFNIPDESSEEIINSTDRTFYITALAEDGTETLMYTGEWRKPSEQDEVDLAIQQAREDAESFLKTESKITEIENKLKNISNAQLVKKQVLTSKAIIPGFVGKKTSKSISTVNRFGMKTPSKIKTNRGNAGSNNQ